TRASLLEPPTRSERRVRGDGLRRALDRPRSYPAGAALHDRHLDAVIWILRRRLSGGVAAIGCRHRGRRSVAADHRRGAYRRRGARGTAAGRGAAPPALEASEKGLTLSRT